MRTGLALLAAALFSFPVAAINVDGTLDAAYGAPIAVQTVQTQFGDANPPGNLGGSELDAVYARVEGGRLFLLFTGNHEPNFNKLEIFIDAKAGGENTLSPTPDYDFFDPGGCGGGGCWISTNLNGLRFDAGFTADYHLLSFWGGGGTPGPYGAHFVDRQGGGAAMVPGSRGVGAPTVGLVSTGAIAAGSVGPNASGSALTQALEFAINNNNAGGVIGGTSAANQAAASAVTTGMEFSIALADIDAQPGDVLLISAMFNNGDHNFLSNQILGGLPAPQGNPGGDGLGSFTGDLSGMDFGQFGGLQYFMVDVPPDPCIPTGGIEIVCDDGLDDDCDGDVDLADSDCVAICGDSQPAVGEECDDGNVSAGDGCSSTCTVEADFTCSDAVAGNPPTPSVCIACNAGGIEIACDDGRDDDCDGLIDGADPDCAPLAVTLESFTAERTPQGVRLRWATVSEENNVGFRILRGRESNRKSAEPVDIEQVSAGIIPAQGSALVGAQYEYLDALVGKSGVAVYYLEDIDTHGAVTRHGPVVIDLRATPKPRKTKR